MHVPISAHTRPWASGAPDGFFSVWLIDYTKKNQIGEELCLLESNFIFFLWFIGKFEYEFNYEKIISLLAIMYLGKKMGFLRALQIE